MINNEVLKEVLDKLNKEESVELIWKILTLEERKRALELFVDETVIKLEKAKKEEEIKKQEIAEEEKELSLLGIKVMCDFIDFLKDFSVMKKTPEVQKDYQDNLKVISLYSIEAEVAKQENEVL